MTGTGSRAGTAGKGIGSCLLAPGLSSSTPPLSSLFCHHPRSMLGTMNKSLHSGHFVFLPALSSGTRKALEHFGHANEIILASSTVM